MYVLFYASLKALELLQQSLAIRMIGYIRLDLHALGMKTDFSAAINRLLLLSAHIVMI